MQTQTNSAPAGKSGGMPRWMSMALIGFDVDSKMACRGLRVSVAVNVFGVGTLLPNDLDDESDLHEMPSQDDSSVGLTDDERVSREKEAADAGASVEPGPADEARLPNR